MKRRWVEIPGFEKYSVSNLGEVRNNETLRIRKLKKDRNGYVQITLSCDGKRKTFPIHRLVAELFIANPNRKPEVNHRDGNKENNCVENLEFVTGAENRLHSYYVLGNIPNVEPMIKDKRKKTRCLETGVVYRSVREASRQTKVSEQSISCAARGIMKAAGGMHWEYLNGGLS